MSQCATCGGPLQPNATRCLKCGASIAPAQTATPQQQAPPPQVVYVQQPGAPQPVVVAKSRVAYILLGLFLGGLGIHNFYAGRTAIGVVQLLITICLGWLIFPLFVVGVWVLVELIAVTRDAKGVPFA